MQVTQNIYYLKQVFWAQCKYDLNTGNTKYWLLHTDFLVLVKIDNTNAG